MEREVAMARKSGYLAVGGSSYFIDEKYSTASTMPSRRALDAQEVSRCYMGFEGEFWPEFIRPDIVGVDGLASELEAGTLQNASSDCRALYLCEVDSFHGFTLESRADIFLGFDVGILESPYNKYSMIYNEILFGGVQSLTAFRSELNGSMLFSDYWVTQRFLNARRGVPGLEEFGVDEPIRVMAIYAVR